MNIMKLTQSEFSNVVGKIFSIKEDESTEGSELKGGHKYICLYFDEMKDELFFYKVLSVEPFRPDTSMIYKTSSSFKPLLDSQNIIGEQRVAFSFSFSEIKRLPVINIRDILLSMLGKKATVEESECFTNMVNYYLKKAGCTLSKAELVYLAKTNPILFQDIIDINHRSERHHFAEEVQDYSEAAPSDYGYVNTDFFDFEVCEDQLMNVRRLVREYHGSTIDTESIKKIILSDIRLFFECYDYSISDTFPREIFFDVAEKFNILKFG